MTGIYTPVTDIRRKVFTEVARMAYEVDDMQDYAYLLKELPYRIIPGEEGNMRSSIFLERAIVSERIRLAIEEFNKTDEKPYRLSASYGHASLDLKNQTMNDFMNTIDRKMYENKTLTYRKGD